MEVKRREEIVVKNPNGDETVTIVPLYTEEFSVGGDKNALYNAIRRSITNWTGFSDENGDALKAKTEENKKALFEAVIQDARDLPEGKEDSLLARLVETFTAHITGEK